jgi:serine/threonine-protein kinase
MLESPPLIPATLPKPGIGETMLDKGADDTQSIGHLQRAIAQHISHGDEEPAIPTGPPPEVGDRVDHYLLQKNLGSGVSCVVFRGLDLRTDKSVALKIINWANVFDRTAAMRQMRNEASTLARVKHPRVMAFIDFGYDPRWPYLVTEFIEGQSLGVLLRSGGSLPVDWVLHIISQMVDGLGAVWQSGVVHRDIKPDNVLIGSGGEAKLIDFGLAKSVALQIKSGQTGSELAGTASYLAPEQAKDASVVDLRADIYSLGVTFYEALTGKLPFEATNRMKMIFHHLSTTPTPPCQVNPKVSPLVSDLCMWMLVKNPAERPQTFDELRQAFDAVMGS